MRAPLQAPHLQRSPRAGNKGEPVFRSSSALGPISPQPGRWAQECGSVRGGFSPPRDGRAENKAGPR